jgi:hypothetical protein
MLHNNDISSLYYNNEPKPQQQNTKLYEEKLPSVSYRISADYGRVEVARSTISYKMIYLVLQ